MAIIDIINRKDNKIVDHYSGKLLQEFSFTQAEFDIFVELEKHRQIRERWRPNQDFSGCRSNDMIVSPDFILNYMRGLKSALDIVVQTQDALTLSYKWQAHLY